MKKPRVKLGNDTYCQYTAAGITDGRVLIVKPELFSYGKTIDMILATKRFFEMYGNALKFEFKAHDTKNVLSQKGDEYIDSGIECDDGSRWCMLYDKKAPLVRLWVKREYLQPLRRYARRYEATAGRMLIAYDNDGEKFAVVMGANASTGNAPYFDIIRGQK